MAIHHSLTTLNLHLQLLIYNLPPGLRPIYSGLLGWLKTALALLRRRQLGFYLLPAQDGATTCPVGYLGPGGNLPFVANLMCGHLPHLEPQWRMPWWQTPEAIRRARVSCDVLIVELPYRFLRRLNLKGGILTQPRLRWRIPTRGAWEEIEARFERSARRDLSKAGDIECVISHRDEDLLHFYTHIYQPYITQRYGPLTEAESLESLRYYVRRGWLVLIRLGGQVVGGQVDFQMGNVMYDYVGTAMPGLENRVLRRVIASQFGYMIRAAWEQGCSSLDLGRCRPLLNDGTARFKRKWGAEVEWDTMQTWGLWIDVIRNSSVARSLLARTPWLWRDEADRLRGLIVYADPTPLDDATLSKLGQDNWMPGLHSLLIYSAAEAHPTSTQNPLPVLGPALEWQPRPAAS